MLLGLGGAFAAALCYGVASVVQAAGVRRLTAARGAAGWPARVWAGRWYAGGLALDGLGFLASVVALRTLPLFLVQTLVAASIGVTAVLAAAVLRVALTRAQVLALVVLAAGLAALAGSAPEGSARGLGARGSWLLLTGVVPLVLALGVAVRRRGPWVFPVLALSAGLGFAGVGICARVLVIPQPWWRVAGEPALWGLAAYGLQSATGYGLALARGSVTVATGLMLAVETVVPGLVGLGVLGDHVRPGWGPLAALGFVLAVGGCLVLAVTGAGPDPSRGSSDVAAGYP